MCVIPTFDDPADLRNVLSFVDHQERRVAQQLQCICRRERGSREKACPVDMDIAIQQEASALANQGLDQCRLPDLSGPEKENNLVARQELDQTISDGAFDEHNGKLHMTQIFCKVRITNWTRPSPRKC